jgi:hypothetical protein
MHFDPSRLTQIAAWFPTLASLSSERDWFQSVAFKCKWVNLYRLRAGKERDPKTWKWYHLNDDKTWWGGAGSIQF